MRHTALRGGEAVGDGNERGAALAPEGRVVVVCTHGFLFACPLCHGYKPAAAMQGEQPEDMLTRDLRCAAPPTWGAREQRVAWCLRNLTAGEKARLYVLLHDAEGLRRDHCEAVVRGEKASLPKPCP